MTAAQPLARYGAMGKARVASGCATLELHHLQGHDHKALFIDRDRLSVRPDNKVGDDLFTQGSRRSSVLKKIIRRSDRHRFDQDDDLIVTRIRKYHVDKLET